MKLNHMMIDTLTDFVYENNMYQFLFTVTILDKQLSPEAFQYQDTTYISTEKRSNQDIKSPPAHLTPRIPTIFHQWPSMYSNAFMMTSSNGDIFRVTGHLCGESVNSQSPVTRSFDVFFDLRLNKRLSKQSWGWWFETPSCPWWRHCNINQFPCYIVDI